MRRFILGAILLLAGPAIGQVMKYPNGAFPPGGSIQLVTGSTITSNGTLSISTAANATAFTVPAIYVDQNGQVGINIKVPTNALHVTGSIAATSSIKTSVGMQNSSSSNNSRVATNNAGTVIDRNVADANNVLSVTQVNASGTGNLISVMNQGTTYFTVASGGNVGISSAAISTHYLAVADTLTVTTSGFLKVPSMPFAWVGLNTNQAIPNSAHTAIFWDTITENKASMFVATSSSVFTVPAGGDGVYEASCTMAPAANATGRRMTTIFVNSVEKLDNEGIASGTISQSPAVHGKLRLAAGDAVACRFFQSSGASLNTGCVPSTCFFQMLKVN